jgi:hypothetical protein
VAASPTVAEFIAKVVSAFSQVSTAIGADPDTLALAPRRLAWIAADTTGPEWLDRLDRLGLRIVSVPGMPTTLGAATNEDAALIFRREEVSVFASQPRISVMPAPGSATLTVRSQAVQYVSALWNRQPAAVAKITGTGMTAPAGI